jgi:GTP pyrophosphokinase
MVSANDPLALDLAQSVLADLSPESQRWRDGDMARLLDDLRAAYGERRLGTTERIVDHALAMAQRASAMGLDLESRLAALLFALAEVDVLEPARVAFWLKESAESTLSAQVLQLVQGLARLKTLHPLIQAEAGRSVQASSADSQAEVLRKMMLAMASDIRVVLLRLISRAQTLRFFAAHADRDTHAAQRLAMARETLAVYAPLANRLGVWQLKWELEDLAFRFIEPTLYKRIARMLDEKRGEREDFMSRVLTRLRSELAAYPELASAQVAGRPKHIYSIWNKMRSKGLAFDQLYDVRAVRIIVPEVRDCYTVLGLIHQLWQPIRGEFDDYISHPKGNDYRSLHTAVIADEGRSLEVQIRTEQMHRHAELGVAAHWRYKEAGHSARASGEYEEKIAWLRQLLSWREDITDAVTATATAAATTDTVGTAAVDWVAAYKRAALDDTIYVMTPQGRVLDLPRGATPIDFAYRVHTDLGNRCRGAKVDGHMVPLATPLATGQRVEIISAKSGGPSRDWLGPAYLVSHRARQKVRQWFAALDAGEQIAQGRTLLHRELHRLGETHSSHEALATRLGLPSVDALAIALARGELTPRAIALALRGDALGSDEPASDANTLATVDGKSDARSGEILIVGVDKLLTQMARCCKPIPPDAIVGFVTRGKGISVHRLGCRSFANMQAHNPERVISAQWGGGVNASTSAMTTYALDIHIEATDRKDLLRDISEVLTREHVALTAMKSRVRQNTMHMAMSVEVRGSAQRVCAALREVSGVMVVRRP